MTAAVSYDNMSFLEFKKLGKELLDALPDASLEEADAGFKCLTLAYLNGNFSEIDQYQASIVLQIIGRKVLQKEMGI